MTEVVVTEPLLEDLPIQGISTGVIYTRRLGTLSHAVLAILLAPFVLWQ